MKFEDYVGRVNEGMFDWLWGKKQPEKKRPTPSPVISHDLDASRKILKPLEPHELFKMKWQKKETNPKLASSMKFHSQVKQAIADLDGGFADMENDPGVRRFFKVHPRTFNLFVQARYYWDKLKAEIKNIKEPQRQPGDPYTDMFLDDPRNPNPFDLEKPYDTPDIDMKRYSPSKQAMHQINSGYKTLKNNEIVAKFIRNKSHYFTRALFYWDKFKEEAREDMRAVHSDTYPRRKKK